MPGKLQTWGAAQEHCAHLWGVFHPESIMDSMFALLCKQASKQVPATCQVHNTPYLGEFTLKALGTPM